MHNRLDFNIIKKYRKNFMKPDRNKDTPLQNLFYEPYTTEISMAKMYSDKKNLWIIGTKDQLEKFINDAIGNCPYQIYNNNHRVKYLGQPFIVTRLYNRQKRCDRIYELKQLGDWHPRWRAHTNSNIIIHPDLFHSIVLSTFTPEEYCKGMIYGDTEINGLKWRYDFLNLKK